MYQLGRKLTLPKYFKFPVTMLTRSTYKCAGWFIISVFSESWYLSTEPKKGVEHLGVLAGNTPLVRSSYSSLSAAIWFIVEEYRQLNHEIHNIEKENE